MHLCGFRPEESPNMLSSSAPEVRSLPAWHFLFLQVCACVRMVLKNGPPRQISCFVVVFDGKSVFKVNYQTKAPIRGFSCWTWLTAQLIVAGSGRGQVEFLLEPTSTLSSLLGSLVSTSCFVPGFKIRKPIAVAPETVAP